ncbi:MAG: glycoside hydrolase family 127 protein, partial [Armatimonadota bacterium]|nr:glycoside hydrolase family 127 protein [Armatimonadota bacterium]
VAETATETGDPGLHDAARRLWLNTTRQKMYVTGSVGSQEKDEGFGPAYSLPNSPGYNESCAACGLVYYSDAMFTLDGEAQSMDVLERTLYNAVLHGISLDGISTYYRNPLSDDNHPRGNIWVCCPPTLSRTLLRVQDYIYAHTARDIYVNLFVGSTATVPLETGPVAVTQKTNYPWDGSVKLTINPEKPERFALRVRIPGWSRGATLSVGGKPIPNPTVEKGYAVIDREWLKGDTVTLDMPMPIERIEANPNVKDDSGMIALQRGPIVYGLEGIDNGGVVDLRLGAGAKLTAEYRPNFLGGVTVITGQAIDGRPLTAIPFYALANREKSRQAVWIRQDDQAPQGAGTDAWGDKLYRAVGQR